MIKKLIMPTVLISLYLFVILISGCVTEEPSLSLDNPCNHLEGELNQINCLLQKAKDENNVSVCYFFRMDGVNDCISEVALKQDNQGICEIIESPSGEDWCYFDFILLNYSIVKRNCIRFNIDNEECKNIQQKMDSACNKIRDVNIKRYCIAIATNSSSKCNEISDLSIKTFCNNFFS